MTDVQWSENVIIANGDYIDRVAFNLIVNFERMLGRRVPPADLARWIDCVALDGGLRPVDVDSEDKPRQTLVVLIHKKEAAELENFTPQNYADDINGKAFKDNLGEFSMTALPVEPQVEAHDFFLDIVGTVCSQHAVKRVMIIPDAEEGTLYDDLRATLQHVDDDSKRITVFTMEPRQGGNFRQEILGYSLMAALGISSREIGTLNVDD